MLDNFVKSQISFTFNTANVHQTADRKHNHVTHLSRFNILVILLMWM